MDALHTLAQNAAKNAYSPYSGYKVGAAAIFDGQLFCGVNVENASYGLTICAERAAIFSGVAAGFRRLDKIAIACLDKDNNNLACFQPCGACLQVIAEFADEATEIILDGIGTFKLRDFMPAPFSLCKTRQSSSDG
jgi:cytidine deaminase